jgi:hypothetical protein
MPVRERSHDRFSCDSCACALSVVDDYGLAKSLRQPRAYQARNGIWRSAGSIAD